MLSRAARRWLSGTLIAALLLMQAAVAAHACAAVLRDAAPMSADCPGHAAQPQSDTAGDDAALCKAHCERGDQAIGAAAPALDGGAAMLVVAVLDWRNSESLVAPSRGALPRLPAGAPPPGCPPLFLSLLVLRN